MHSCGMNSGHSYEEYEAVFNETKFDTSLIGRIDKYDSLQKLIFENISIVLPEKEDGISTYSIDELSQLENPLKEKFQQILIDIGEKGFESFSLTRDSVLSIKMRTKNHNEIDSWTEEYLEFRNNKIKELNEYPFRKDTLIGHKWTYVIFTEAKNDI